MTDGDSSRARFERAFTALSPLAHAVEFRLKKDVHAISKDTKALARNRPEQAEQVYHQAAQELTVIAKETYDSLSSSLHVLGPAVYSGGASFEESKRATRRQALDVIETVGGPDQIEVVSDRRYRHVAFCADSQLSYVSALRRFVRAHHHE